MNVASSGEELLEQPEGLTEVSSQSDKTDLPLEDVSEAATSADQEDMDQSGESGEQKQVVVVYTADAHEASRHNHR